MDRDKKDSLNSPLVSGMKITSSMKLRKKKSYPKNLRKLRNNKEGKEMERIFGRLTVLVLAFCLTLGIANAADVTLGLVGHWPLDGNAKDTIGGKDGKLQGGAKWTKNGYIKDAVELDGSFEGTHFVGMSGAQLPLNEWTHVTAVVETGKQGGILRLFTNGKLTKETVHNGLKGLPGDLDTKDVLIGRTWEDARFFGGLIDEVALFKTSLVEDDINTITNKGLEIALGITAVSTAGKLTTTWASIKFH